MPPKSRPPQTLPSQQTGSGIIQLPPGTTTPFTAPSPNPIPALVMSPVLQKRIHDLLITSRQIESIARQLFKGQLSESQVAWQLESLEKRYQGLQEAVESELEGAWMGAGWLDSPSHLRDGETGHVDSGYTSSASGKGTRAPELKRKADEIGWDHQGMEKKKRKKKKKAEDDEWEIPLPAQPVGIPKAMIPLKPEEKERMLKWTWEKGYAVGGPEEVCLSPRGVTVLHPCAPGGVKRVSE